MPPKQKDPKAKQVYKAATQLKDVIPPTVKNPPRDPKPIKIPDQPNKVLQQEYQPLPDPEEWPGDEVVRDINLQGGDPPVGKFVYETDNHVVFWRRPRLFLRKKYPIESDVEPPYMTEDGLFRDNDDQYSTRIESKEKIAYMQNEIDQSLTICESYERQETHEEFEIRKKEFSDRQAAQAAQKKKGTKKGPEEVFDENYINVKDVRLSDVVCTEEMPPNARWIASQLQMIKDRDIRDCNNSKPLSAKIYPQKDGAPIYNPSGKYIIKLYFMGKERKIQITDHMPVNFQGKPLLPYSVQETQLWPMLISKAVLQLWDYQSKDSLVGDGFVMYALMGLLTETIDLKGNSWNIVEQMMGEYYNSVYLSVYGYNDSSVNNTNNKAKRDYQNEVLRNQKKLYDNYEHNRTKIDVHEEEQFQQQEVKMVQEEPKPSILPSLDQFKRRRSITTEPTDLSKTNLHTCFSYSVLELFQNDNGFNMYFAQKRTDRELRMRQEYIELCKTPMTKMTKEEKLEYRRKRKELKEKMSEDEMKRRSQQSQQPVKHKFLKLKSDVQGSDPVSIFCPFAADEIYIAKKCIVNKLNRPPNYELPEIRGDDKSVISQNVKDESFSLKPLEDFSAVANAQEPIQRGEGGFWIHEKEFLQIFDSIQISYDPRRLNTQAVQVPINPDSDFATYDNLEMLIVQRDQEQDENHQVQFLFGFQAKYSSNIDLNRQIKPFAMLQRYDLETFESIKDYKILNQSVSSQMVLLDNKNHVFRLNIYSPLNFTLWLSSSNKIQTLSIAEYLIDLEGYQTKSFTVDYPACESGKYFVFFRFKIQINSNKDTGSFVYKVKSTNDNSLLRYLKLKIIEIPPVGNPLMLQTIEGVHKNLFESESIINGTQRFNLKSGVQHYFILEGIPPYNVAEGSFEMDFLTNSDVQIQQIEQVEPMRYSDKYTPTKYGIIFRERIFANDSISSFFVRLAEGVVQQQNTAVKGKQTKGGAADVEIVESEMKGERLIRLELLKGEEIVIYNYGINQALLSNVQVQKDGEYILQALFDLREWPEAQKHFEETESIFWFLTVYGSDTVAIIKDTTKEDKEKAIKKSWEDKEPGRAANAKKSRAKYLISLKPELTEEEQAILNAPRLTKKQREEEAKQATQKKAPKKEDKKGKQTKVEVQEEKPQQRVYPRSDNHVNEIIHEFLGHLEQDRIMDHYAKHAGLINIRNDVQKREIIEGILMAKEQIAGIIARNLKMREEIKFVQRDQKEVLMNEYATQRQLYKQDMQEIIQQRDQLRSEISVLVKKEQQIFDLCKQEKVGNPDDLEKLIQDPAVDQTLVQAARQQIQNWKVLSIQDKMVNALSIFDIDTLQQCMDQIRDLYIEGIDTSAAEDMLDEAASNPNFVQEKQAELKKQGKKPGKK
ncbi:hypothetical protein pb186bvf_014795 [Paramecium bursaria]